jgi:hypothetical protein
MDVHEESPPPNTFVMRGLDPRIHRLGNKSLDEADGLPGQARQ